MSGWQNVVAWVLHDPDKINEKGEMGRDVATLMCNDVNGGGTFNYVHVESRYMPQAEGDFTDYKYSGTTKANRALEKTDKLYDYTKSLQLYAVDAYGNRYASQSNTK
jgi:hypothetical protein